MDLTEIIIKKCSRDRIGSNMEYQFQPKLILNRKLPALRITAPDLAQYTANGNRKRKCLNLEMLK